MIDLLSKLKTLCISSVIIGILGTTFLTALVYFPVDYVSGALDQYSEDIIDLKVIVAGLPQIQSDISDLKDDVKSGFNSNHEDIVKLRLLICENSQGRNCN